jgi:hypothetical protein
VLREIGYENVLELKGGFSAWKKAGFSIATGIQPAAYEEPNYKPVLGLKTGQLAIDFWLKDVNGIEFSLFGMLVDKPVVLEFGSYT